MRKPSGCGISSLRLLGRRRARCPAGAASRTWSGVARRWSTPLTPEIRPATEAGTRQRRRRRAAAPAVAAVLAQRGAEGPLDRRGARRRLDREAVRARPLRPRCPVRASQALDRVHRGGLGREALLPFGGGEEAAVGGAAGGRDRLREGFGAGLVGGRETDLNSIGVEAGVAASGARLPGERRGRLHDGLRRPPRAAARSTPSARVVPNAARAAVKRG